MNGQEKTGSKKKSLVITAWMGMTVRNLLFGPTLAALRSNFDITIVSHYGDQLRDILGKDGDPIHHSKIANPRWNLPSVRSAFAGFLDELEYHALWASHRPASAERIMMEKAEKTTFRFNAHQIGGQFVNFVRKGSDRDFLRDLNFVTSV